MHAQLEGSDSFSLFFFLFVVSFLIFLRSGRSIDCRLPFVAFWFARYCERLLIQSAGQRRESQLKKKKNLRNLKCESKKVFSEMFKKIEMANRRFETKSPVLRQTELKKNVISRTFMICSISDEWLYKKKIKLKAKHVLEFDLSTQKKENHHKRLHFPKKLEINYQLVRRKRFDLGYTATSFFFCLAVWLVQLSHRTVVCSTSKESFTYTGSYKIDANRKKGWNGEKSRKCESTHNARGG